MIVSYCIENYYLIYNDPLETIFENSDNNEIYGRDLFLHFLF